MTTETSRSTARTHTVKFPDSGNGNATPFTLGASLVIVYRSQPNLIDPEPLRGIVIYDGGFTIDQATDTLIQPIAGFYQASTTPNAHVTMIVGDGQSNFSEKVLFNDNIPANRDAANSSRRIRLSPDGTRGYFPFRSRRVPLRPHSE